MQKNSEHTSGTPRISNRFYLFYPTDSQPISQPISQPTTGFPLDANHCYTYCLNNHIWLNFNQYSKESLCYKHLIYFILAEFITALFFACEFVHFNCFYSKLIEFRDETILIFNYSAKIFRCLISVVNNSVLKIQWLLKF